MTEELTPSQAARRIGATTRTVQRWIAAGTLPARRVGGRWRVASDAIDAFAVGGGSRAARPASEPAEPDRISTLFIANRGEIARRIARTTDRLRIASIVPDTEGPDGLDLLDADAVVTAAAQAGSDALHPGFGFLAESADFAERVLARGIRWVGPPPAAIRAMGDKAAARRLAASLGIPVIPGYDDADQSDRTLEAAAARIGPPILVKPAAGGGGKGIRIVRDLTMLPYALAAARREAVAAFGDGRLILERFLEGPRHVEVQVLFDRHGHGVHLGERDCSIQRRHQKVLEETPSPAVNPATRRALGEAALTLANAVGYIGAGTCEFLLDEHGSFMFLEMNTRLQVEHPVTELVTGRDLVADQLRIAAGDELGYDQAAADAARHGHAVEVRVYAEDADAGFLPATGRVEALRWPTGEGIRVDSGIDVGTEITGRFDPMLAKVIAHGSDRRAALDRLARALDETTILGLTTNLRFLRWLVRQPVVLAGEARIDTLDRIWPPDDWADRTEVPDAAWTTAAELLAAGRPDDPWTGGWRLNSAARVRLMTDGATRTVDVGGHERLPAVHVGETVHVDVAGLSVAFAVAPPPDVDRAARAAAAQRGASGPIELVAPMPGAVLAVHAGVGELVQVGVPIVTLEAMKMEHAVTSPAAGRVTEIRVAPAEQVTRGAVLAVVEPEATVAADALPSQSTDEETTDDARRPRAPRAEP